MFVVITYWPPSRTADVINAVSTRPRAWYNVLDRTVICQLLPGEDLSAITPPLEQMRKDNTFDFAAIRCNPIDVQVAPSRPGERDWKDVDYLLQLLGKRPA